MLPPSCDRVRLLGRLRRPQQSCASSNPLFPCFFGRTINGHCHCDGSLRVTHYGLSWLAVASVENTIQGSNLGLLALGLALAVLYQAGQPSQLMNGLRPMRT